MGTLFHVEQSAGNKKRPLGLFKDVYHAGVGVGVPCSKIRS